MATTDEIPASSSSSSSAVATSINRGTGSSSSYLNNRESSGASSSTSASQVCEEEEARYRNQEEQHPHQFTQPEIEQQQNGIRFSGSLFLFDDASAIRDDTWSCVIVILTFWFFVSMTVILGVYGPASLSLGPNTSLLIEPNPIFVQSIKVEELEDKNPGPMLYGFYKSPPLDVVENWSIVYNVSVPAGSHKEWIFYLNKGSEVSISYNVNSPGSSVFLIIAQGKEGLAQWLEDPTYPNSTLSWNIIQGSGIIQQSIWASSFYNVAVGNMNSEKAEVELRLTARAFLYNTTTAYCNCNFADSICSLKVLFPSGNAAVLTSPPPKEGSLGDEWNVKLSFGPRWATYIAGIVGITLLMLVAFNFFNNFQFVREDGTVQFSQAAPERTPLLLHKNDDLSSWGSSYDSLSNDEQEHEELVAGGSFEGKPSKDGEDGNNQRLCAICFDAPRDCFFLPCGHCIACFACGMRIAEAAGTCPICRRSMKKVKKIFSV